MAYKANSVPKYRHHKGTNQAFVQVKGHRHYLGKWDSPQSKEAYARFIAERAAAPVPLSLPLTTPESQLTVVELCAAYMEFADGYYRKDGKPTRSIEEARAAIRIMNQLYGQKAVAEFGPLRLLAIQKKLVDKGNCRSYVNKLISFIKRIFRWGVSRQLVPPNVLVALSAVDGLKKGRTTAKEPEPIRPISDDVVEATLPFLPPVVADMVRFQQLTGCRPGEVCQLRPCDLDRSNSDVWEYRPQSHKTDYRGNDRIIYVGPKSQKILLPYLLRPADAFCFSPAESVEKQYSDLRERRKTKVQPSQKNRRKPRPQKKPGNQYTRHSYRQAIARAVLSANRQRKKEAKKTGKNSDNFPSWHPNQLRHSAATRIRRQFGLEAAQVILGHAKANVTQIYAERDAALAVEVSRQIG